jgi:hypothetical protein
VQREGRTREGEHAQDSRRHRYRHRHGRARVNKFGAGGVPANDIDGGFSTALATGQLDFSGGM